MDYRRLLRALPLAALLAASAGLHAAEPFPDHPIQMIVPVGGGGSTDVMLRAAASYAEPLLGQSVITINRPGASGMLGVGLMVHSPANGYTIGGVWSGPITMAPHLQPDSYKPEDYVVVATVTEAPGVFCVKPDFPASNGTEFLEELRRHPDKYTYGNEGVGGFVQLAAERIFSAAGVKVRAIPFSGANQTATAFLGGHIDIFGGGISSIVGFEKEGKAKCLLLTSAQRHPALPQTQSLTDVGLPQAETLLWRAVIAPAGTPPDRLAKLSAAFRAAVQDPRFKTFAEQRGESPWQLDQAAAARYVAAEYKAMGALVARLGLKAE